MVEAMANSKSNCVFPKGKLENRRSTLRRQGAAVVELAFVLPVMLLITFGTLEICEFIFLRQKIEIAAHEGARAAIRKESTAADVRDAVRVYLDARGVEYDSIADVVTVTPDPQLAPELTPVTVRLEIDISDNLRLASQFYQFIVGDTTVSEVAMYKEFSSNQLIDQEFSGN